jgi:hypothetical protein
MKILFMILCCFALSNKPVINNDGIELTIKVETFTPEVYTNRDSIIDCMEDLVLYDMFEKATLTIYTDKRSIKDIIFLDGNKMITQTVINEVTDKYKNNPGE